MSIDCIVGIIGIIILIGPIIVRFLYCFINKLCFDFTIDGYTFTIHKWIWGSLDTDEWYHDNFKTNAFKTFKKLDIQHIEEYDKIECYSKSKIHNFRKIIIRKN